MAESDDDAAKDLQLPQATPAFSMDQFSLSDCTSTITGFTWLGDSGPGNYPEGWEPRSIEAGVLGSTDYVELIQCERLAWGQFERPVSLVFESHSKFTPQGNCGVEETPTLMLHSIWTNDSALAGWLVEAHSLPMKVATIDLTLAESGGIFAEIAWRWNTTGEGTSTLTLIAALPEPQTSTWTEGRRYLYDHGSGMSAMDVNFTAAIPSSPEQVAFGSFDSSTLHGSTGVSSQANVADYWFDADASGRILEFGDYLCDA